MTTQDASGQAGQEQLVKSRSSPASLRPTGGIVDLLISSWLCGIVLISFMLTSDHLRHWFVIPTFLCGAIIGKDAVAWVRGRTNSFGPVGVIGLLGFHFFFLAPLLNVYWDHWNFFRIEPDDWRPWLGRLSVLNLLGISAYLFARHIALLARQSGKHDSTWELDRRKFSSVILLALVATGALQMLIYMRFGGIGGYVSQIGGDRFDGMGPVFMVAESFPILAFMAYAVAAKRNPDFKEWKWIILALLIFVVLKLLFGGLRGSRSNTIWGIFWAVGIVHLWIRPFSRHILTGGLVILFAFMYVYGFFERGGTDGLVDRFGTSTSGSEAEIVDSSARTIALADLARSDIQAFILFRIDNESLPFPDRANGRTYLGALALLVPDALYPGTKPPTKLLEGTELMTGPGQYELGMRSSRVYGLAGEAMLNFGPWSVPLVFAFWGALVGITVRWMDKWSEFDIRWLIAPLVVNFLFVVLSSDSDNAIFFLFKNGFVPLAVIVLSKQALNSQLRKELMT